MSSVIVVGTGTGTRTVAVAAVLGGKYLCIRASKALVV